MEELNAAASWLRGMLAQPWLEEAQGLLARTPDWALLAAGPSALVALVGALWLARPRRRKSIRDRDGGSVRTTASSAPVPRPGSGSGGAAADPEPLARPSETGARAAPQPTRLAAVGTESAGQRSGRRGRERRSGESFAEGRGALGPSPRACGVPEAGMQDRKARVFLSSTFRDMRAEREVLATDTFPSLKRKFRARGVEVQEVDLRWGVNEGDATLDLCLAAVRRSNWFVGLIGQRYGTTLEDPGVVEQLGEAYPVVRDGLGLSLTELEILEGVLANAYGPKQALFFERDPAWLETLPAAERINFEEPAPAAQQRLAALKQRIEERLGPMQLYAAPGAIGPVFEETMAAALERAFPVIDDGDDPFMQEHRLHAAYGRERLGLYVGGEAYLGSLTAWMGEATRDPLLIVGASGGGKSTLVAQWTAGWARAHPDDLVLVHYLGASPDSANPAAFMRRLWLFLNRVSGEDSEAPGIDEDLGEVRDRLSERLEEADAFAARAGARILIVLDGLDKLSAEHRDLLWWPSVLPGRVRLLASSLEGQARESAQARGWRPFEVKPFGPQDQGRFIAETLKSWNKSDLTPARKERVLAHPLAGLPLFLKAVLEELRVSAANDVLDARLDDYLKAETMPDLYARILAQVERECGRDFVAQTLSLIWAGRAGLEEDEIVAVTAQALGTEPGQAGLSWERLRNRLAEALRDNQGRIAFAHDYLRQGVEQAYLATDAAKRQAHLAIAARFEARAPDLRQAEELPYQLRAAGVLGEESAWVRLEALLTDLDRFELLRARGDGELAAYWTPLRDRGRNIEALLCDAFAKRFGAPETWSRETAVFTREINEVLAYIGSTGQDRKTLLVNATLAFERLARDNPGSASAQRDLIVSYVKMQESLGDAGYAQRALELASKLQAEGRLSPSDAWMIPDLRRRAGEAEGAGGGAGHASGREAQDMPGMPMTAVLRAWRDGLGWADEIRVGQDRSSAQLATGLSVDGESYHAFLEVNERAEQLGVYLYASFETPPDRRLQMCLLLNRINLGLDLGRFALIENDGSAPVQWLGLIEVEGSRLAPQQIQTLLSEGINAFRASAKALAAVVNDGKTADEAFAMMKATGE